MKLIRKLSSFKDKDGKEKTTNNFYLELSENVYVAIRPVFDDDKKLLKAFSTKVD